MGKRLHGSTRAYDLGDTKPNTVFASISNDLSEVTIRLISDGIEYLGILSGTYQVISVDNISGYAGVYEGVLTTLASPQDSIHVISDITFTNDELFLILTTAATETISSTTLFYGELSDPLRKIANKYSELQMRTVSCDNAFAITNNQRTVEASTLQRQRAITVGSEDFNVGYISVFHLSQSGVQALPFRAKINTNSSGFVDYLKTDKYPQSTYTITSAKADRVTITVESANELCLIQNNTWAPGSSETTFTIPLPYINSDDEFDLFDITVVTSSTTVTTNSSTDPTRVTWQMYKQNGFANSLTDGDSTTESGIPVRVDFIHDAYITSTITRTFYTSGNIRYTYVLSYPTENLTVSEIVTCSRFTTTVRIIP